MIGAETRAAWAEMAGAAGAFFLQPEVFDAWRRHLAGRQESSVLVARDGARLLGVMPLVRTRAWRGPGLGVRYDYDPQDATYLTSRPRRLLPVRQLSPVLSLPGTFGGPVALVEPRRAEEVRGAFAAALAGIGTWDVTVLPLPRHEIGVWQAAMAHAGLKSDVQRLERAAVTLDPVRDAAAIIAGQSQKARQNVRRSQRAAQAAGLDLHLTRDTGEIVSALASVAAASWKATGRADQNVNVPYSGRQQVFFEGLLSGSSSTQFLAVMASRSGAPIAIILSAVVGRTLTTLLTFWNGDVPDASPGALVLAGTLDWAAANAIERVDFNSNAPLVSRFANRTALCDNLLVYGPGLWGRGLRHVRALARSAALARRAP